MPVPIPRIAWPVDWSSDATLLVVSAQFRNTGAYSIVAAPVPSTSYATPEDVLAEVQSLLSTLNLGVHGDATVSLSEAGFVSVTLTGLESGTGVQLPWRWPPVWQASTAYPDANGVCVVRNDNGKIYTLATSGTSAGSGGPTGTGSSITDGTAVWDYVGTLTDQTRLSDLLGFTAGDSVGGTDGSETFTADRQMANLWTPNVPARFDRTEHVSHVTVTETAGGQSVVTRWTPSSLDYRRTRRRVRFEFLQPRKVWTAISFVEAFESFWRDATKISRFTYSPDRSAPSADADEYFLVEESARNALEDVERMGDSVDLHALEFTMGLYT